MGFRCPPHLISLPLQPDVTPLIHHLCWQPLFLALIRLAWAALLVRIRHADTQGVSSCSATPRRPKELESSKPSHMATVDFGRYKRIVQMFWDPEPTNDVALDQPVWCLGLAYTLADEKPRSGTPGPPSPPPALLSPSSPIPKSQGASDTAADVPSASDSTRIGCSNSADTHEPRNHGGWPAAFLDDFESKLWMTYRSDFDPIPKSSDPQSLSALSFQMRVKSQLVDQNGFSSDSGWGCMIRSGQSLLANTVSLQRLGRGMAVPRPFLRMLTLANIFA